MKIFSQFDKEPDLQLEKALDKLIDDLVHRIWRDIGLPNKEQNEPTDILDSQVIG